jgi:NhaP-type Na+/H+ or K+/H+ antiporter
MKDLLLQEKSKTEDDPDFKNGILYLKICGNFFALSGMSIGVGTLLGVVATLMLKNFRFISHSAIGESSLMICFAMIGYFISEIFELSGIVSILCTSLIFSHYAWFNLSPQGKNITSILFQTLGYIAEGTVFIYLGVSSVFYLFFHPISWSFIGTMIVIIVVGRYMAVYISYYIF